MQTNSLGHISSKMLFCALFTLLSYLLCMLCVLCSYFPCLLLAYPITGPFPSFLGHTLIHVGRDSPPIGILRGKDESTCYLISLLQCLCQPAVYALLSAAFSDGEQTLVVSEALLAIVKAEETVTLTPKFVSAFEERFQSRLQQTLNENNDIHEALACMCAWLKEEQDPFDHVFGHEVRSTTQCNSCNNTSTPKVSERACCVLLTISEQLMACDSTIQEVYNQDLAGRPVPDYQCLKCGSKQPAVIKAVNGTNPSGLLVIYLSRHVNIASRKVRKHSRPVVSDKITHADSDYVLVAAACHIRNHYFTYVRRWVSQGGDTTSNSWYKVDDAKVEKLNLTGKRRRGQQATMQELWRYCYLLFYVRSNLVSSFCPVRKNSIIVI